MKLNYFLGPSFLAFSIIVITLVIIMGKTKIKSKFIALAWFSTVSLLFVTVSLFFFTVHWSPDAFHWGRDLRKSVPLGTVRL